MKGHDTAEVSAISGRQLAVGRVIESTFKSVLAVGLVALLLLGALLAVIITPLVQGWRLVWSRGGHRREA